MKRFSWVWIISFAGFISVLPYSFASLSGSLSEKAIEERLKPVGEVTVEAGSTPVTVATSAAVDIGQQRYQEYCHICHETGLAGAPKFGDKAGWAPRIAEGMDVLLKHAIDGYKAMPAKGTCLNCSDDEIKKAIEYMISHSK